MRIQIKQKAANTYWPNLCSVPSVSDDNYAVLIFL
jgi:hypothetical protein